jgi:hypothetical protein
MKTFFPPPPTVYEDDGIRPVMTNDLIQSRVLTLLSRLIPIADLLGNKKSVSAATMETRDREAGEPLGLAEIHAEAFAEAARSASSRRRS